MKRYKLYIILILIFNFNCAYLFDGLENAIHHAAKLVLMEMVGYSEICTSARYYYEINNSWPSSVYEIKDISDSTYSMIDSISIMITDFIITKDLHLNINFESRKKPKELYGYFEVYNPNQVSMEKGNIIARGYYIKKKLVFFENKEIFFTCTVSDSTLNYIQKNFKN